MASTPVTTVMRGVAAYRRASARLDARLRARRGIGTPAGAGAGFLVALVVLAGAYFIQRGESWNADSHLFLTASIVDRGSLNIDPFMTGQHLTGDVAAYNGHFYTDKAPGLSLLAVPVYALLKLTLLGGQPYAAQYALPAAQQTGFLVRYLLAVVFAAVPTALLAVMLYRFLPRLGVAEKWCAALALVYALGTFARPFAGEFFSHQLTAALIFGAFVLLYRVRHGELRLRAAALAGLLAGYAVISEYPAALLVVALGLYALTMHADGRRAALALAAGALPSLLVGAVYNTLAFGGPLSQGYAHLAGPDQFRQGQALGFMGITYPHLDALWQTTLGPYRGIFLLSPVLLLAVPGFIWLWRQSGWRAEAALWLGMLLVYGLFTISYFAWEGGFSMGPREFLPALPFLVLPIGALLRPDADRRWKTAFVGLGAVSVVIVELATAAGPLADPALASPLTDWALPRLLAGRLDNNWGMLFGLPGVLQLLPLCALAALILWRHWRPSRRRATVPAGGQPGGVALGHKWPEYGGRARP